MDEDSTALNINDGDDIIHIGNGNTNVYGWGQGGNDKLIGGYGPAQLEKLYGGSGDDKIWMVSPENRALDIAASSNFAYGGIGDDFVYGTDAGDRLAGDEHIKGFI